MRKPSKDRESVRKQGWVRSATDVLEPVARESRATQAVLEPAPAGGTPARKPWVIVLAGGEGRRLREFTKLRDGVVVPKQFCHFRDDRTLFTTTVDRALRIAPREQVVVVVIEAHRAWWEPEVARLSAHNVLSQPANRGTAVALLHALAHIRSRDASPNLVVMPSDHDFEDEGTLLRCVDRALDAAELFPREIVLLGIVPSHLDAEYGLIAPGTGMRFASRPVRAFFEKPSLTIAARLTEAGALWNSFIFACTGVALDELFETTLPWLAEVHARGLSAGLSDARALSRLFEGIPEFDFSRDVLQRSANRLRLVEVPACGWTDLGTPARLAGWLDRHREAPFWREHRIPFLDGPNGFPGSLQTGGA